MNLNKLKTKIHLNNGTVLVGIVDGEDDGFLKIFEVDGDFDFSLIRKEDISMIRIFRLQSDNEIVQKVECRPKIESDNNVRVAAIVGKSKRENVFSIESPNQGNYQMPNFLRQTEKNDTDKKD